MGPRHSQGACARFRRSGNVEADVDPSAPRVNIKARPGYDGRLGVTTQSVDDTLYDAYGQRQVATITRKSTCIRTVLEVAPQFQLDETLPWRGFMYPLKRVPPCRWAPSAR